MATKYKGHWIKYEPGEGYYWQHGGCTETVEECRREIDDWHAEDFVEHTGSCLRDTPALEPAWWEHR